MSGEGHLQVEMVLSSSGDIRDKRPQCSEIHKDTNFMHMDLMIYAPPKGFVFTITITLRWGAMVRWHVEF